MSTRRRKRRTTQSPARLRKPATWLHLPFGALIESRCPAWVEVQLEVLLQRQPQRLDQVYLLRAKTTRDPRDCGHVMRGLWVHIRTVGLAEFKSVAKPFARGDLYRLVGCGWTWLHQNSALTPDDLVLVLIVADVSVELRDELAQCGATFTRSDDGYHRAQIAGLALVVVELDAVAEAEKDDYLRAFSHHAVETAEVVQWLYPYLNAPEGTMIDSKQLVGKEDLVRKIVQSLSTRELLEGLSPQQREEFLRGIEHEALLHRIKPEERLADLSESEQVLALSDPLLRALSDDYIATLPADVQAKVRARRNR